MSNAKQKTRGNRANPNFVEEVEVAKLGTYTRAQTYMLELGPQSVQGVSLLFSKLESELRQKGLDFNLRFKRTMLKCATSHSSMD